VSAPSPGSPQMIAGGARERPQNAGSRRGTLLKPEISLRSICSDKARESLARGVAVERDSLNRGGGDLQCKETPEGVIEVGLTRSAYLAFGPSRGLKLWLARKQVESLGGGWRKARQKR
jgi:hypothetical protein